MTWFSLPVTIHQSNSLTPINLRRNHRSITITSCFHHRQCLHVTLPPNILSTNTSSRHTPILHIPHLSLIHYNHRTRLSLRASSSSSEILVSDNHGASPAVSIPTDLSSIEVDAVTEVELRENGFRSTRRTKIVCTIGPATRGFEDLEALALGGMNVARINMCHGRREWHKTVIDRVRRLNQNKGFAVAIMMDTEGSEIHMGDLGGASSAKAKVVVKLPTMLSGESAMGQYLKKALNVLRSVSLRIEKWWREKQRYEAMTLPSVWTSFSKKISEEICNSAAKIANNLKVDALFVYTKHEDRTHGSLLSRCRPDFPIFAFTTTSSARRNLQWGLIPFWLSFSDDMESNLNKTFSLLKAR